ncbi:MAG: LysR family transcriptional regulator [Burkholderiaceae bacterium]
MPDPLDPKRLRHLLAAVDAGSLTVAAEGLGLSQPALSMSIKALELELGVALLERHRHGVRPTAYGDILVGHARSVEVELGQAALRLRRLKQVEAGAISIGCGPAESSRLLPMALTRLQRAQPQIRVFVEYGLNESLMPLVAKGDIAFALSSVPRNSTHPELEHRPLYIDSAVVVARAAHPLARRRVLTARDLAAYPWVLARRWELERNALDQLFAEAGLAPIVPEIETTSATLMKTIVVQSDFLSFVPREMIHWEERAGLLRPLKGIRSSWARQVGLTTRRDAALSEPGRLLVDSLREIAAGLAAG